MLLLCSDAQDEIVANVLLNFPAYAQQNDLDPSDILTEPLPVQLTGINAEFTNYQLFGHSKTNVTIQRLIFDMPNGPFPGRLDITILLGNQDTSQEGNYNINGTLSPNITISGEGKWTAKPAPGGSQFNVNIMYNDIRLSEDGRYVNLKGSSAKYGNIAFYGTKEYKLEGISAGGQEERITNVVMNSFFDSLRGKTELPIPAQIMQYLEGEFEVNILFFK